MAEVRVFRLRVTYGKCGRLAYLSHLEVARALERSVRRAGLPYAVSQGFSPHMKIAFGPALPVGVGGTSEIFDIQLTSYIAPEKALAQLQKASPDDLRPVACAYIEPRAAAASVAFKMALYQACLSEPLPCVVVPDEIVVIRKRKEKVLRVSDYLIGDVQAEGANLTFALRFGETGSLRSDVLVQEIIAASAGACSVRICQLTRVGFA